MLLHGNVFSLLGIEIASHCISYQTKRQVNVTGRETEERHRVKFR